MFVLLAAEVALPDPSLSQLFHGSKTVDDLSKDLNLKVINPITHVVS